MNNGLFKVIEVKASNTLIRVKSEIYGEVFSLNGQLNILTVEQVEQLELQFNELRIEKGWSTVKFRVDKEKEVNNDLSNSSEVQGQKTAKTL